MPDVMASHTRIGIYTRISRDDEGRAEGVGTQEQRARAYAEERWPDLAVQVFSDNDRSASNGDPRPGYKDLIAAVRRGEIDHIVCAEQSRLTRNPSEWEDLIVVLGRAGITEIHTYRKGVVSLGSKLIGRIMTAVDAEESERIKARVSERHAFLLAKGRPRGGLEYGYRSDEDDEGRKTLEIQPEEADVIRWMADRLLAGWSLTRVAHDLNTRNISTVRGRKWSASSVRRVISKPSIAGYRRYPDLKGTWQAIIPPDTWRQTRQLLDTRAGVDRRARRRFLLTGGIARCGRCGGRMAAQQRWSAPGQVVPLYFCRPPSQGGCSGVAMRADPLESYVASHLFDELDKPDFWSAMAADDRQAERQATLDELDDVNARQSELGRLWAQGQIDAAGWRAAAEDLEIQYKRLNRALVDLPPVAVANVDPQVIRSGWQAMNLDERRAVLGMFVEAVIVGPARTRGPKVDLGRVTIEWRDAS